MLVCGGEGVSADMWGCECWYVGGVSAGMWVGMLVCGGGVGVLVCGGEGVSAGMWG